MRAICAVAIASLVALDVNSADAQSTRGFKDSWFWGFKGGATFYQVQSDPDGSLSPLAGTDWLITRTIGGLYASFDHTFFQDQSVFINDSVGPVDTIPRRVFLSGMRRFTLAGVLFPYQRKYLQTYFGLGAMLNQIDRAEPEGTFRNPTQERLVNATVREFRTSFTPVAIVGLQLRLLHFSGFVQGTSTRATRNFFLFNGNNWRSTVEAGVRYNIGSSIDPMR